MKGVKADFIAWFGIKCSSFVSINSGHLSEVHATVLDWIALQLLNPTPYWKGSYGFFCDKMETFDFSKFPAPEVNLSQDHLLMLTTARPGVWGLEQPGSSVLEYYPAWLHFLNALYQLFGMDKASLSARSVC